MNAQSVRDMLLHCRRWHQGFSENRSAYYSRLEIGEGAKSEDIEAVESAMQHPLCPELTTIWQQCSHLQFEWFVKQRAAQEAGIDSRQSAMGTFELLSPSSALKEREFVVTVGDPNDQSRLGILPFGRVGENREILAVNHDPTKHHSVELVVFDSELNRLEIAPNFGPWLDDWRHVLFEERFLYPGHDIAHSTRVIVDVLSHFDFEWPPAGLKDSPFESD